MKNLKITILVTFAAFLALGTSCKENGSTELDPFYEYATAVSFYDKIVANGGFDGAIIVDFRSPSEYAKGHIKGAINIEATYKNAGDVNGAFINELKTKFGTSMPLFLYGTGDNTLVKLVGGNVSKSGYGKSKTHVLGGSGFNMWKTAGYPVE
jgi:rhodanese-related sulfurtransferase